MLEILSVIGRKVSLLRSVATVASRKCRNQKILSLKVATLARMNPFFRTVATFKLKRIQVATVWGCDSCDSCLEPAYRASSEHSKGLRQGCDTLRHFLAQEREAA
jgi:hypothetical protein